MNRGINAARSKYLGVLEPDDFVLPEMFAELYAKAVENNADFVKADFYFFRENPDGTLDKRHSWLADSRCPCNRVLCPLDEPLSFRFASIRGAGSIGRHSCASGTFATTKRRARRTRTTDFCSKCSVGQNAGTFLTWHIRVLLGYPERVHGKPRKNVRGNGRISSHFRLAQA